MAEMAGGAGEAGELQTKLAAVREARRGLRWLPLRVSTPCRSLPRVRAGVRGGQGRGDCTQGAGGGRRRRGRRGEEEGGGGVAPGRGGGGARQAGCGRGGGVAFAAGGADPNPVWPALAAAGGGGGARGSLVRRPTGAASGRAPLVPAGSEPSRTPPAGRCSELQQEATALRAALAPAVRGRPSAHFFFPSTRVSASVGAAGRGGRGADWAAPGRSAPQRRRRRRRRRQRCRRRRRRRRAHRFDGRAQRAVDRCGELRCWGRGLAGRSGQRGQLCGRRHG